MRLYELVAEIEARKETGIVYARKSWNGAAYVQQVWTGKNWQLWITLSDKKANFSCVYSHTFDDVMADDWFVE